MKGFASVRDHEKMAEGAREEMKRGIRHKNGGRRLGYLIEIAALPRPVI
jgi:hypothetical protein